MFIDLTMLNWAQDFPRNCAFELFRNARALEGQLSEVP